MFVYLRPSETTNVGGHLSGHAIEGFLGRSEAF